MIKAYNVIPQTTLLCEAGSADSRIPIAESIRIHFFYEQMYCDVDVKKLDSLDLFLRTSKSYLTKLQISNQFFPQNSEYRVRQSSNYHCVEHSANPPASSN
jgi:hypothetical protein